MKTILRKDNCLATAEEKTVDILLQSLLDSYDQLVINT